MTNIYDGLRSIEHSDNIKKALSKLKKRGIALGPPCKATPKDIDMIIKLRRGKNSIAYIANEVGLSVGLVHKLIHRFEEYIKPNARYTMADLYYD